MQNENFSLNMLKTRHQSDILISLEKVRKNDYKMWGG